MTIHECVLEGLKLLKSIRQRVCEPTYTHGRRRDVELSEVTPGELRQPWCPSNETSRPLLFSSSAVA
jgi:hypothetical protein